MKKKTITGYLAAFTFLLATVALQLYFNKDHYFAMNRAKCSFTMIVFIGALITALVKPIEGIWKKQEKQKMTLLDWCVLVFGCCSIVTCLLSRAPELTLVGTKGMFVGAFTYFTGMMVYFVVSRNMIPDKLIAGVLLVSWGVIFIWTIVNQCGTDVFGMHQNMRPNDVYSFVSSMGNVNSASDAFATMVPFVIILLILTRKNIFVGVCIIGLLAIFALNCEGVLIGLLLVAPFVVLAALSETRKIRMVITILLSIGLSIAIYHFLCICTVVKAPDGFFYVISKLWAGEIITVLSLILLFLNNNESCVIKEKTLIYIRLVLVVSCVAAFVIFVSVSVAKSMYDPCYGNGRGAVWKGNVWTFRLYKPIEMIFGQGSGMFAENATLARTMLLGFEKSTETYATSHNSLLQALLGNGIIGLLCLLIGLFALIRDWFRDLRLIVLRPMSKYNSIRNVEFNEVIRVASFTAIMGYFGASLVESTYPHTVMLLFAMLALYRSSFFVPRKKKVKQSEEISKNNALA